MSSSIISEKVGGTRQIDLTNAFNLFELRMREHGYDLKDFCAPSLEETDTSEIDIAGDEESPLP